MIHNKIIPVKKSLVVTEDANYQIDITNHGIFLTKISPQETHDLADHQQAYLRVGDEVRGTSQKSWFVYRTLGNRSLK